MGRRGKGNTKPQLNKPSIAPAPTASQAVITQMAQQYALTAYGPNAPIVPYPGLQPQYGPRQWQYPIATNLDLVTRENLTPFEILRQFAQLYDAIALCKQAWFDCAANLEPAIEPAPGLLADDEDASKYADEIAYYQEFFETPDKQIDIHEWMNAALNDLADIDAVVIYPRKTRGGELYSLDLVDGATVKPLLDDRGRTPEPPSYAYEQIVYGAPSGLYTSNDLLYLKEHTRTNSAFGFSRVESVLVRINQALRKQNFDLAKFTDGNVPAGFLSPAADVGWTPDQMIAYQQMFDAAMAGNDALKQRLRWVPPGSTYTPTAPAEMLLDLDKYILTMTGGAFGVMLPELGFTETVNKSSGETQEDVTYRRTMRPIAKRFARLFNLILRIFFNERRFIFTWKGYEGAEDFGSLVTAHVSLVEAGIESTPKARRALKLPADGPDDIPAFIMTTTGPFVVEDLANSELRKAQVGAQIQGLQLAATQPQDGKGASSGHGEARGGSESDASESSPPKQEGKRLARAAVPDDDEGHTGMMIAFYPNMTASQLLALPGGEKASDLHVTLAYLGEASDFTGDIEQLKAALTTFAAYAQPLVGRVSGVGRFAPSESSDGLSPIYASVDVQGLQELRKDLVERLALLGCQVAGDFAYTPHITLAYVDADAPMPVNAVPAVWLVFESLWLCIGDQTFAFRLGGEDMTRAARADLRKWRDLAMSRMKAGKQQRAFVSDSLPEAFTSTFERTVAVCASPDELRLAFAGVQDRHFTRLNAGVDADLVRETTIWQSSDPTIQSRLAAMRETGTKLKAWQSDPGACDVCLANNGQVVPVDEPFASGAYLDPQHDHCDCGVVSVGQALGEGAKHA